MTEKQKEWYRKGAEDAAADIKYINEKPEKTMTDEIGYVLSCYRVDLERCLADSIFYETKIRNLYWLKGMVETLEASLGSQHDTNNKRDSRITLRVDAGITEEEIEALLSFYPGASIIKETRDWII